MGINDKSRRNESYIRASKRKAKILGECFSKARRKLVNLLVKKAFTESDGNVYCVRCGEIIEDDFHIDHIKAWLYSTNPIELYYDLKNIGLSHPICNSLSRRNHRKFTPEEARLRATIKNRLRNKSKYHQKKLLQKGLPNGKKKTS